MGLSRLDNFLKNVRGNILYVNPNDLDSTDSIENQGNSLTRPFKTIQRALIESARFSYQKGLNNDRFGQTTILVYPGDHIIDNRPGWIPDGVGNFQLRSGATSNNFPTWDLTTNFDLSVSDNALYKMNSVSGGVFIPRGTSLVGLDLRKTKIRPKYVPNPTNDNIERSSIFRVTGGCYFWQFSMFDADPNGQCYVDYTDTAFVPNFSHHKLTCFEYADGINDVSISDAFLTASYTRTDLEMFYEKVGLAYGQSSGRAIEPDYPSSGLDIQPKIDEYRIVGSTGSSAGITSIRSGDGVVSSTTITVTTDQPIPGLDVDTPFRVRGITTPGYNGQFVVSEKLSDTEILYQVQNAPLVASIIPTGATLTLNSDTVTSASPYIFNCSLRSVYGMCGLHADGDKATGFKSMVVAQFTGIGLQKDDNAFVLYDEDTGTYNDNTSAGNEVISTNSRAIFKPEYKNFHIKASNDAFIQNVSVFAIGYAEHFSVESGGDMSITNSNSNFGAKALIARGFRRNAFSQDDIGYITHIIPPKEITTEETSIEFDSIDVEKTIGIGNSSRLYLYNQTNFDVAPESVLEGYRIGAKENENLSVLLSLAGSSTKYNSKIVMPESNFSSEKISIVNKSVSGINSITNDVISFTSAHSFINGESIRILSGNGHLPDGITPNTVYYAVTSATGITTNIEIKIAKTADDALRGNHLTLNEKGGSLKVVSRVSDKFSGDIGHPIQYDSVNEQWYINTTSNNNIYSTLVGIGITALGSATPRTFIERRPDDRNATDIIYRLRYVIPASSGVSIARPPSDGFIIQESNKSTGSTVEEIESYFGTGSLNNINEQRNFRFIANVTYSLSEVTIKTEIPHNLSVGSEVEVFNVKSTSNPTGEHNSGYNRTYTVSNVINSKKFSVSLNENPGTFSNNTSIRDTSLPYFKRKLYKDTFVVYRTQEVQQYISGKQDGIYYLTVINASNSPSVAPFTDQKYSQPVKELYPQTNRDNPLSDPQESVCFAAPSPVGIVQVDDVRHSITKETTNKIIFDSNIGIAVTNIISRDESLVGSAQTHEVFTKIDHGLNRITRVSIANSGSGYGSGVASAIFNVELVGLAGSITGSNATAKVVVDASGGITDIKIMDGGSAYKVGNTLSITGISTFAPYTQATVQVTQIYDNIGDVIRLSGISSNSNSKFNTLYRIIDVPVGYAKTVIVSSSSTITGVTTTRLSENIFQSSFAYLTGPSLRIASFDYNASIGIATIVTTSGHGLKVDNKISIVGSDKDFYNGSFIVKENISLTSFTIGVGKSTLSTPLSGTAYVYKEGVVSKGGVISVENENLTGRMISPYAGITTSLSATISTPTTESINILNVSNLDINIGDYLQIDDEIVRVKTAVPSTPSNPIYVFRGVLGTRANTHQINSVITKISPLPVELRRHSIMRASGHTFEYVGFGPGNYSTAFPDKQDRSISQEEELLAQSTRENGGTNFYTGMNDKGISYAGNKKLSTVTGQEEIFDTPIQTVTGEDIGNLPGVNVISPIEGNFSRSIRVEGGSGNKSISEFNGPVVLRNKLTSTSEKGIESNSLYLQGDSVVSRKYTVGISTPLLAGNAGDVVYYDNPSMGGHLGWVYTTNNDWYRFGAVSLSKDLNIGLFDQVGIATTSPGNCKLKVGSGSTMFCVDGDGVGIGTSANIYKLNVNGNTNILGNLYARYISGDGSGIVNLNATALGWTQVSNGIYNTSLNRVGLGTTAPRFNVEVGAIGTSSTTLYVNGQAKFVGIITANNVFVSGILTATGFDLQSASGRITAGIVTTTELVVGSGGTIITTSGPNIGIGTLAPRAKLDIEGSTRLKTYSEAVENLDISTDHVIIDLSKAQTFTLDVDASVNYFQIINCPSDSSSWTIKIKQNSTGGYSVDIDDFRTSGGSSIDVYWPGGGVLPIVTTVANRSDIYSFKTFDGGLTWHGFVGGQNFL
jgi:hypothetical protein